MIRVYGEKTPKIVLVHGGPGAIGSLKGFARELSDVSDGGVAEALQSKYTIAELVEELYSQILENSCGKVTLIGHSWGAWLVALVAAKYPAVVERIILVGCPPLQDKYVSEISARRMKNLSEEECAVFQRLIHNQATDADMQEIPRIFGKSDNFCLENRELHNVDRTDSRMHNVIWSEAAKLRSSGELLEIFSNIKCKIYLIQGERDPHPWSGVIIPLQEIGVSCESHILEKCGHSPFMEKYAKEDFYRILLRITGCEGNHHCN